MQIPLASRSRAWVCDRLLDGIVVSNPSEGMDVSFVSVACVVKYRSLRRADHLSRGGLPNVVCLNKVLKPRWWGGPGPRGAVAPWGGGNCCQLIIIFSWPLLLILKSDRFLLSAFAKLRKATISFVMFDCPFVRMEQLGPFCKAFHETSFFLIFSQNLFD
jgi:hypothetical protein